MNKSDKEKERSEGANFFKNKVNILLIFLYIAFTVLFYWCLINISQMAELCKNVLSVFMPLIYGFFIAFIINLFMRPLESVCDKLFKKRKISFKIKRALCLTISIILVVSIVLAVLFLVIPELVKTVYSFIHELPKHMASAEAKLNEMEKNFHTFNFQLPELNAEELEARFIKLLTEKGFDFVNMTINLTSSIFSGVFNFVVSFFFAIYMLVQKEKLCHTIKKFLFAFIPISVANKILSWTEVTNKTFTKFIMYPIRWTQQEKGIA